MLYLNDGITVFKPSAIDVATVVGDLLSRRLIEPLIIVGIDNGASTNKSTNAALDRATEYLPYPDGGFPPAHTYSPEPAEPRGALYPTFLVDEVMPLVGAHYRVSHRSSDTAVGGFSYGGDAALFAVIRRPGVFGKLLLESTPLWIGKDKQLLADARGLSSWPARVYLGVGGAETSDPAINAEGLADLNELRQTISEVSPATSARVVIEEGASHGAAAWRRRLPVALQFLFGSR